MVRVGRWPDVGIWPPLPPKRAIGGGPKERESQAFSHRVTPLRQPRELAEWVECLEENAHFGDLEAPFGGGGSEGPKWFALRLRVLHTHPHTHKAHGTVRSFLSKNRYSEKGSKMETCG